MTNETTTFSRFRHRFLVVLLVIVPIGILILISIMTGYFAPLQTSEVISFGTCTQNHRYEPVSVTYEDLEVLYICGILEGRTRRYLGFSMFHEGQRVFYQKINVQPGTFFIPVQAPDLRFIQVSVFPVGEYQISFSYERQPVEVFTFTIGRK